MMYDELGTLAARGRGIVWDSKDSTGSMAMWVALTQQGPTSFARRQLSCLPALAPGNRAHWGFGKTNDGVKEADSGHRQCPQGPAWESQEVPWGLTACLAAAQISAVPPQQYGAIVKPQCPLQLGARLQAVRLAVGHLGLCFHIQTAHLPPTCHSSRICFAVTFWGYQASAGWVGVL